MNTESAKPSPFDFDVYQCPECDYVITVAVYTLILVDVPCSRCGKRKVSEYELRKGKHGVVNNKE